MKFNWSIFLIITVPAILYYPNIFFDFVYDDRPAILTNDDVIGSTSLSSLIDHDFWGNPIRHQGSHKSWRPLTTITYRLQWIIHGPLSELFHVINISIHLLNCLMVYQLSKYLLNENLSTLSSILFSIHPINTEAVCSIVGRADLLACFWTLSSILLHRKYQNQRISIILSILGILSKETSCIILPILIFLNIMNIQNTKKIWAQTSEMILSFFAIIYFRLSINNFEKPTFSKSDNPFAHEHSFKIRCLNFLYLPYFHFQLIVFPSRLSFDWSMNSINRIVSFLDFRVFQFIVFYFLITFIFGILIKKVFFDRDVNMKNTDFELLFLMVLLAGPHLISSNIIAYVGFVAAERILYLPNVAFCILLCFILDYVQKKLCYLSSQTGMIIITVLITIFAFQTTKRINDWKNEESLFQSALTINPAKAHGNLGHVYAKNNQTQKAKYHYMEALKHQPTMSDTWYNLAILLTSSDQQNHMDSKYRAISAYQQAIKYRPTFAAAHLNLGLLMWDTKDQQKGLYHLEKCWSFDGAQVKSFKNHLNIKMTCALNLGRFYQKLGHYQKSIDILEKGLRIDITSFKHRPSMLNTLGKNYEKIGQIDKAEKYYNIAIEMDKNYLNSFLTMAQLKLYQNKSLEANNLLEKAFDIDPTSITVLQNIALAAQQNGDFNRSLHFYQKANSKKPDDIHILNGIATMLREIGKPIEAEKYFERISVISPASAESHANYGAILHYNKKYIRALSEYDQAIQLKPSDQITIENRNKLIRILKKKYIL